jgi:hypothetical protein
MSMKSVVAISGVLRTLQEPRVEGKDTTYKVKVGNVPLEEYVAEHCKDGGYFKVELRNTKVRHELSGQLDVFMMKLSVGYYQNGWRVGQETERECRIHLGGQPISTMIGRIFRHEARRTYYDQGWYRIIFTKLWC